MFGKIFESMYRGSLVGQGALTFAVWGYVIANQRPDREVGSQVELNPKLLAAILGEEEGEVARTVQRLCEPDPESRSKEEDGRRLIRLGQYAYKVVNGTKYRWMANEEARREVDRTRKAAQRAKKKGGAGKTAAERLREKAMREGDLDTVTALDRMEGQPVEGQGEQRETRAGGEVLEPNGEPGLGNRGEGLGMEEYRTGPSGDSPACEELDGEMEPLPEPPALPSLPED